MNAMDIANDGMVHLDYLSASLAGARAIIYGREGFEGDDELLYLIYLLDIAQEHAEKARTILDESSVWKRRPAPVAAVAA
jgi:hypothetical protein